MSESIEERFSRYVSSARFEDLTPAAVDSAKRSTLDTIGAMLAGSSAAVRLDDRKAAQVVDMIGDLENVRDVSALIPLLCRGEE